MDKKREENAAKISIAAIKAEHNYALTSNPYDHAKPSTSQKETSSKSMNDYLNKRKVEFADNQAKRTNFMKRITELIHETSEAVDAKKRMKK